MPPRRKTANTALIEGIRASAKVIDEQPVPTPLTTMQTKLADKELSDLFFRLNQKLPRLEPQTIRSMLHKVKQFLAYLEREDPANLSTSADSAKLPKLLCDWLTDVVNNSHKTVSQPRKPQIDKNGAPVKLLMSSVSLLTYRGAAQHIVSTRNTAH